MLAALRARLRAEDARNVRVVQAEAPDRLEAWCATAGAGDADTWGRADIEEHVRDEHSTFTWLLEPLILRAGFVIEDAVHSDDGIDARYVLRRLSAG